MVQCEGSWLVLFNEGEKMAEYGRYISFFTFLLIAGGCSDPAPSPDLATTRSAQSVGEPEEGLSVPGPERFGGVRFRVIGKFRGSD